MKKLIPLLTLFLLPLAGAAEPFSLVSGGKGARVVIAKGEPSYVALAVEDLVSDVCRITGTEIKVVSGRKAVKGDVYVRTVPGNGAWESYDVSVAGGVLNICGSDARGTMFGVYDFIEKYLGVDPLSYWNDTPYPSCNTLQWDDVAIHQDSPQFKFRGWFVNDEDFFTAWKEHAGLRKTGYKFYDDVINYGIVEKVVEALVRCRNNMIIPSSYAWPCNPVEKKLLDICSSRGVFITMHHQEPMGVSGHTFKYYWEERGESPLFSFYSNPEKLTQMWEDSARILAEYPDVIWQIGLRGRGDKPMWESDPSVPKDRAVCGKVISDAMKAQIAIIDKVGVPKENRHVSTTLWMEGASLNNDGLLDMPEGTIVVFSDNGPGWHWNEDFYTVKRKPGLRYGVYYHPAVISDGPHFASLVPVSKMYSMMKEAVEYDSSEYAIINVSNVHEFTYNIDAMSRMLWNIDGFSPEEWDASWLERHYGKDWEKWATAYHIHYNSLQLHPVSGLPMFTDGYLYRMAQGMIRNVTENRGHGIEETGLVPEIPHSAEGDTRVEMNLVTGTGYMADRYVRLCAQAGSYELAKDISSRLYEGLSGDMKPFAYTTIVYPSTFMYIMSTVNAELIKVKDSYEAGETGRALELASTVRDDLSSLISAQQKYSSGKWENWYGGPLIFDVNELRDRVDKMIKYLETKK